MKTLIIYNHPHEGSFCSAIRDAVQTGLDTGGHSYKLINLDADGFDPVMREKDLEAFVQSSRNDGKGIEGIDPLVRMYADKMRWAERIVMIFPIWWMTMPAMTKGFIDKVIFPGVAYEMDGYKLKSRLDSLEKVTIITTMNTPADVYKEGFGNSIENSLIKGTFHQIGIKNVEWLSLNKVKQTSQEQRHEWLELVSDICSA